MELFLHQIISGLAVGSIYGLFALSLVVTRLALGSINFAQGEIATFTTYIAWFLINQGFSFATAFVLTVMIAFLFGLLLESTIFRPVEKANFFSQMVVFIGLLLAFNGLSGWIFGYIPVTIPGLFSRSHFFFTNNYISLQQTGILCVTIASMIMLALFFRFTALGLKMRACAENPILSQLSGIPISRMWAIAWGLSAAIGAIVGILIAPVLFLEPNMMGEVLFYALTAAVIGGVDSPVGVVLGGVIVSIIENLTSTYLPFAANELKLPIALFIIMLVLLIKPAGFFGKKHNQPL